MYYLLTTAEIRALRTNSKFQQVEIKTEMEMAGKTRVGKIDLKPKIPWCILWEVWICK